MRVEHKTKESIKDITDFTSSITWGGNVEQVARYFSVSFLLSSDALTPKIQLSNGDVLKIVGDDEKEIISGVVFRKDTDRASNALSVSAYDSLIYLLKNTTTKIIKSVPVSTFLQSICAEYGVKILRMPTISTKIKDVYRDMTIFDMMVKALSEDTKLTKKKWICRAIGNDLVIEELGSSAKSVYIGYDTNEISLNVTESIEETRTAIVIRGKGDSVIATVENAELSKLYGRMQHQETNEKLTKAKAQIYAKNLLEELGKEQIEINVESLGDPQIKAGDKVNLVDDLLEIDEAFVVTQDDHTYSSGLHTMSLTLKKV